MPLATLRQAVGYHYCHTPDIDFVLRHCAFSSPKVATPSYELRHIASVEGHAA